MTTAFAEIKEQAVLSRESPSRLLGLARTNLKHFWDQSLRAGGRPRPITKFATLLCAKKGQETVLFRFPRACRAKLKNAKGFSIRVEERSDGGTDLSIENGSLVDEDIFAFIALDLLELDYKFENDSPGTRFGLIVGRLKAWRQFMQDRSRRLTPQQELGLAGELYFLRRSLEKGVSVPSVASFWTGPKRAARDFTFGGEVFVEVKTSTTALPLRAKIDSLEQLDAGSARALFLCAVVLRREEADAVGDLDKAARSEFFSLDKMANDVEVRLPDEVLREEFRSLLIVAGLGAEQREESRSRFQPQGMRFFRAEALPSITPGKIPGIVKAAYEIELLDAAGEASPAAALASVEDEAAWVELISSGGATEDDSLDVSDEDEQTAG